MATNAIYMKPGTAVTFTKSGGDVTFTLDDTVDLGDGQVSNQWDRGAGALPGVYKWKAAIKWVATPTLGDTVRIYLFESPTNTGDLTSDAAVTPETKFNNFRLIGTCICSVAADQVFYASGTVEILGRYVNLGVWNGSATKDLNATDNVSYIVLTPYFPDIQAAA
ncbi:MAG TPA: hypothetical protein VLM89_13130 [Phycisphaerae bacterium]|nr:hypothetical protein [Phycisphaerae bacterium]